MAMATAAIKVEIMSHLTQHHRHTSRPLRPLMAAEPVNPNTQINQKPHLTHDPDTPAPTIPLPVATTKTSGRTATLLLSCLVLPAPRGPSPTSNSSPRPRFRRPSKTKPLYSLGSLSRSMSLATEQAPSPLRPANVATRQPLKTPSPLALV